MSPLNNIEHHPTMIGIWSTRWLLFLVMSFIFPSHGTFTNPWSCSVFLFACIFGDVALKSMSINSLFSAKSQGSLLDAWSSLIQWLNLNWCKFTGYWSGYYECIQYIYIYIITYIYIYNYIYICIITYIYIYVCIITYIYIYTDTYILFPTCRNRPLTNRDPVACCLRSWTWWKGLQ